MIAVTAQPVFADEAIFTAIDEHDYEKLLLLRKAEKGATEAQKLANAIVHSMLGDDARAEKELRALEAGSRDSAIDARALRALSGVMVRMGRYADTAKAMRHIREMDDSDGVTIDDQSYAFFNAMSPIPRMGVAVADTHDAEISRDKAGLPRIPISVNGVSDHAIFDTGAAFSTVTTTMANKMNLRQLGAEVDVGGSTNATVQSGIAIADRVRLGGAEFTNVPFIVVPDESMSFPEQQYFVTSVLGLPIIRSLGRIEWSKAENEEHIRFGVTKARPTVETANMITSGWEMVLLAHINQSKERLRFFLDTGAVKSAFYSHAKDAAPSLMDGAETGTRRVGGLGGVVEELETLVIPSYRIKIDSAEIEAGPSTMQLDDGSFRHGVIGQDTLQDFGDFIIDFGAMTLTPAAAQTD
ncbi:MAG: retropepsin-like aspartic protease [Pseudomonadota bacterium]